MRRTLGFAGIICALVGVATCAHSQSLAPPTALTQPQIKEVQVAANAFSRGTPLPAWVETVPMPERDTSRALVERLGDTQFYISDQPTVFIHFAMTVNDASMLSSMSQLPIGFVPEYQRLELHSVRILRGTDTLDRTQTAIIRFLQSDASLSLNAYNDIVTASVLVEDIRVGDTIEYSYSIRGQNPVFGGKFVDYAGWDQPYPVTKRRISLVYPADRKINWRMIGEAPGAAVVPSESSANGQHKIVFEGTGLAQKNAEPSSPPDYTLFRWIQFSEFTDWNDVSRWADGLFARPGQANGELSQQIELLKSAATDQERVAKALEFVQSEIRYFAVAIGENSHRPEPPDFVLQRRYGDCKDKAFLMVALLRPLGIDIRPVLLSVSRRKGLEKALPSPLNFDHAIVKVHLDQRDYYLDPTRLGQHGRLDRMGQPYEGFQALVVAPDTKQLAAIASPNALELKRNDTVATARVTDFSGDVEIRSVDTFNGIEAEALRVISKQISTDQLRDRLTEGFAKFFPSALATDALKIDDDTANNVLTLTSTYKVPKLLNETNQAWYFLFIPTNLGGAVATPTTGNRSAPLQMPRFPFEGKYTLVTELPSNVQFPNDRVSHVTKSRFFSYEASSAYRGNKITTEVSLKTLVDAIEPAEIAKYAQEIAATRSPAGALVAIPKKFVTQSKIATPKADPAQSLKRQRMEEIASYSRQINSKKLKPAELASAYCERSAQYANLNKMKDALRDVEKAVELDPQNASMWICRGEANFDVAAFESSIADYTKAISLNDKDPYFYRKRGQSEFYSGNLLAAVEDLKRAGAGDDRDTRAYSDIWLAMTFMRLNQPLPDDLISRAGADPRGSWPLPILAVLGGHLTSDDLLKMLDQKTGDEGWSARTEAHFYLGHYYLHLGDKQKAREEFQKTRELNLFTFIEFRAAKFELDAMTAEHAVTSSAQPSNVADPKAVEPELSPAKNQTNRSVPQKKKKTQTTDTESEWNRSPLQ